MVEAAEAWAKYDFTLKKMKSLRTRIPPLRAERNLVAEMILSIDPSMGRHPQTFPQCQLDEGHTRGARACRTLQYAANESVTNEYLKPYPTTSSP